jgi:hypothetical protein
MIFCFVSQIIFAQRETPYPHRRNQWTNTGKPFHKTRTKKYLPDDGARLCIHTPPSASVAGLTYRAQGAQTIAPNPPHPSR